MEFGCRILFVLSRTMTNYPTVSRSQKLSAWAACSPRGFRSVGGFLGWRPPAFADTAVGGRDPNPTNPHRNGNGASTSNNGYYVGEFICAAETARAELGEGYCR